MQRKVLIVGATGVVGQAALAAFAAQGWDCVALSRRRPDLTLTDYAHLPVDLTDARACVAAIDSPVLAGVSHVVYAALFEQPGLLPGWQDPVQMQTNLSMLRNLLEPLLQHHVSVTHISLLQGTKAYGAHLHPISVPARESSQRDEHENFYWLQEDYLKQKQQQLAERTLHWTILRPQIVFGYSIGSAMNLVPVLGVYAALCRAAGQPLSFPGGPHPVQEAVDADLLARVLLWVAQAPNAADEVFNVTNGDVYRWCDWWPDIADALGVDVGPDAPRSLAQWLPTQQQRWQQLAQQHDLRVTSLTDLLGQSHYYADALLGYGATQAAPPALVSTIKLRQAGFHECVDSQVMLRRLFAQFSERGLLPGVA